MKPEESQILAKLGREPGFKVPQGYFEDLTARVMDRLPEVEITDVDATPTLWMRVRPYVYLAAMFAGVWCMMTIFNRYNGTADGSLQRMAAVAADVTEASNADDFLLMTGFDDYDIIAYDDSTYDEALATDEDLTNTTTP
ncbi:MAG: hypothetical protein IJU62_03965 [Muribaculaceae bacterium]|nr:hypothetical protein [Muribaculaceae bacterium]